MSDLLSDFLNDRLQPVPVEGVVNGIMDYEKPEENTYNSSDSESESDTEQQEYIKKELSTYFPETEAPCSGGLTDIEDGHEESVLGTDIMELLHVPKVFETYKFDTYYKKELPIDSSRDKILDMINTNSVVIIHGPTGCGKTTQVPQYILDHCRATKSPCNIVVTQPRRIAAINIAQRVCEERGWAIGTVCGYQVGLDKNVGDDVILTYMTTEVLLQKLISQKNLNRFTHVIIDEVHERSKSLDFLLLIVRKYLFTNSSSVKIILMSATMEAQDFAYYFRSISRNNPQQYLLAPVLPVTKKSEYKVSIYYNEHFASAMPPYNFEEPCMHKEQYDVCAKLISLFDKLEENESKLTLAERINGSVLVFLPGFHEIEEMHKVLVRERNTSVLEWEIIPLHSSLAQEHMVKAFQKPRQRCRKIILSTNIAESSVTVPDVNFVIDFCLTKNMTVNEVTKFSSLSLQWASYTNCIQRAGRVGRVANGRVYRVVPTSFYLHEMKQTTVPELQRAPLENVILYMKLLGLNDTPKNVLSLALSPPNLKDVEQCVWHLKEVGALLQTCRGHRTPADGDITFMGRVMGSLPIDIHLSKLILLGHMFSCLDEAVIMAAGCMTKNIFVQNFYDRFRTYRQKLVWADGSHSDFMILLNLYNVWLSMKRDRAFSSSHQEIGWCKTHFVNLKGLREWDILIQEIHSRLKRLNIQKLPGPSSIPLSIVEKPMVLKVIICGAFYPYYFIKSSDFGNVDAKEAVKILNGRDPCNTVYFTNMKMNQPGQIYVRQIKKLMNCEDKPNVQIGFDPQSTKVFVEFKATRQPEQVTIDGRQYIATVASNIAVDVYEAVRKRQMRVPFVLRILPDSKAWEFANMTQAKRQIAESEDVNCFTTLDYSPLPTLDIEYITVTVTHIIDAGHFYCQNWNEETRMLLDQIFAALNGPGVFLEPAGEKIKVNSDIYAALFNEDGKFYRCKVIDLTPGQPNVAQVCFIDYGNVQRVPKNRLYKLPENSEPCRVQPIAMCCVLSGVQPDLVLNPKALWSESVNNILRKKTTGVLLNAKVFSVVDEVVHLELFLQNPGRNSVSFNQWLINEGLGQKCEESQRSKMDHEMRLKVQSSEDPSNMSALFNKNQIVTSYADFEAPESSEATEIIELKGPFSPLEMKVCGLVQASQGAPVHVDGDSVNAVMLDDNPEDYHATLLVAGQVSQSSTTSAVKISQTTIMPNIPGFPMLMCLLFCPQMEPKLTPDGSRVASILCGLGYKEVTQRANFPMHDICLVLDTDLRSEIITKINALRYYMNEAIKIMSQIQEELARPEEMYTTQRFLKDELFHLLHMRQQTVDRVNVRYPDVWNKGLDNMEILRIDMDDDEEAIWSYLWFVKFGEDRLSKMSINKNLDELTQIARRTAPEREIKCELCNSATLRNISDVRIHLFREEHKSNLAKYLNQNK
ncbi:probable ATP-dependent RNA helicase spindle-E [Tribolium castaneum]|uniref:Probable ATP-dependent RNA helicase spindle-E n=1 Tax=Tribolium castaneum TaxID=7070 RepID=D6WP54_TRICA|nr:PREDICTED: probable ATP-dependent RNA helicase spindle-E [Tribolium castaneum]EFA07562.1 spindle E [Tribolium castaneum]|eukprot:XP_971741.1 PREDICTED: probable ATP-dependent RNA helicase spindle-E [Tribolium castaneum]